MSVHWVKMNSWFASAADTPELLMTASDSEMPSAMALRWAASVPQYTLDEVFDKKDAIASDVNQTVSGLMVAYGYDVVSTLIR